MTLRIAGTLLLAGLVALGLTRPPRLLFPHESAIRADYARQACLERAVHQRVDPEDRVYVAPDPQYFVPLVEVATPWARVVSEEAGATVVLRVAKGGACDSLHVVSTRR